MKRTIFMIAGLAALCVATNSFGQSGNSVGGAVGGAVRGTVTSGALGAATGGAIGGSFTSGVRGGVVGGMLAPNSTATDDQEATHMLQGTQSQPSPFAPPQFDSNE